MTLDILINMIPPPRVETGRRKQLANKMEPIELKCHFRADFRENAFAADQSKFAVADSGPSELRAKKDVGFRFQLSFHSFPLLQPPQVQQQGCSNKAVFRVQPLGRRETVLKFQLRTGI